MNIVYFLPHLREHGGMGRVLNIKANYLADVLNYNVTIITYRQHTSPICFDYSPNIKFVHLDLDDPTFRLHTLSFFERRKQLKNFMNLYRSEVTNYLLANPTDVAISMFLGAENKFLCDIPDRSRKVLEFHLSFTVTRFASIRAKGAFWNFRNYISVLKLKKQISQFDQIVVLTEEDAALWQTMFSKVYVISNPLTIQIKKKAALQNKAAIAVGRLVHEKGFDLLIDSWTIVHQNHPDWVLHIYGDGPLENDLRKKVLQKNLQDHIFIHAAVSNIGDKYSENSLFVLSSRQEGFPLVLLEAMSAGLPCVAYNCKSGPAQLLNNGENGILVEAQDITALSQAISLLIQNPSLCQQYAAKAQLSAQDYSLPRVMGHWTSLFQNLLHKS